MLNLLQSLFESYLFTSCLVSALTSIDIGLEFVIQSLTCFFQPKKDEASEEESEESEHDSDDEDFGAKPKPKKKSGPSPSASASASKRGRGRTGRGGASAAPAPKKRPEEVVVEDDEYQVGL